MPYWFNLKTRQVEAHDDPERARSAELMGPYDSREAAEQALETARQRTEAWDEEDRKEAELAGKDGDADQGGWDKNPLSG